MDDRAYDFWLSLSFWSEDTFGLDIHRGPIGPLKHLQKEVEEALKTPDDLEEYADLLFLVFDSTRRAGFGYHELMDACREKLKKNKKRLWPKPSLNDEPIEHIRDEDKYKFIKKDGNEE